VQVPLQAAAILSAGVEFFAARGRFRVILLMPSCFEMSCFPYGSRGDQLREFLAASFFSEFVFSSIITQD
jgi:hypothetical protein